MTNTVDYKKLGERIRRYRHRARLTQEQLAGRIEAATSTVAHAESGTSKPSLPLLIRLSNALDVSLDQLLCDSLPVAETYVDRDIGELLADCTLAEKKIIRDIVQTTKETLREHQ